MPDGSPIVIGNTGANQNTGTKTTTLSRSGGNAAPAFDVENSAGIAIVANSQFDAAIIGSSEEDVGVTGSSERSAGVNGVSNSDVGVFGQSGLGAGVAGHSDQDTGVVGTTSSDSNAIVGQSEQGIGIFGTTNADDAVGVYGSSSGNADAVGVWGFADGPSWPGVEGYSETGQGVRGVSTGPEGPKNIGVLGWSVNGVGVRGESQGSWGGLFRPGLVVVGLKSAAVPHRDGSYRLLYCMESPESWFEDFGRADLVQGRANIKLEEGFAAVVRTDDYHVFLSPEGETNGLYVRRRNRVGFEVREQQRGTSSVSFSYRIVAKRKDIEAPRLAKIDPPSIDAGEMVRKPKEPKLPKRIKAGKRQSVAASGRRRQSPGLRGSRASAK